MMVFKEKNLKKRLTIGETIKGVDPILKGGIVKHNMVTSLRKTFIQVMKRNQLKSRMKKILKMKVNCQFKRKIKKWSTKMKKLKRL